MATGQSLWFIPIPQKCIEKYRDITEQATRAVQRTADELHRAIDRELLGIMDDVRNNWKG